MLRHHEATFPKEVRLRLQCFLSVTY